MEELIQTLKPDQLVYAGAIGLFLGLLFFLFFLYHRLLWLMEFVSSKSRPSPEILKSLRNLILIALWTSVFGMLLFLGFFLRTYQVFTDEVPVAELVVEPLGSEKGGLVTLVEFSRHSIKQYEVKGDQWMVEGDIVKWDNWLYLFGLQNRYRLTRLSGRYVRTADEANQKRTIHALVKDEEHPLWRYLYEYGQWFPLVDTVYGNAVFQSLGAKKQFQIYIGTSGLIAREKK
jgi:hypothetical protein